MSERKEERLQAISIMRVMAMLMIVAYHSMLFYTPNWWRLGGPTIPFWEKTAAIFNAIDLPMFVFISGVLFGYLYIEKNKYRNKLQFVIKKFKRLIVPYVFWGLFLVLVMPSVHKFENLFTGISHLWFLLMLFEVFLVAILLADFLCNKASRLQLTFAFVALCVVFVLFHTYNTHHFFLCLYATLFYLPAFMLGVCCARFRFQERFSLSCSIVALFIALTVLACYIFLGNTDVPFLIDYVVQMLTGYVVVVCLYVLLTRTRNNSKGNMPSVIAHIDKLSMGIYIFNQIVINAFIMIPGVRLMLGRHYYIGVPVLFTVGLVVPWLLALLFNRSRCLKWTIG